MLCVYLNQIPSLPLCDANGLQVNAILHPGWFSRSGQVSPSGRREHCLKQTEGITSFVFYETGRKGWRKKGKGGGGRSAPPLTKRFGYRQDELHESRGP